MGRGFFNIILMVAGLVFTELLSEENPMRSYQVYKSESYVVVEKKEKPEELLYKEYIRFSDSITNVCLCTKEGRMAKNEGEAYLHVDLGEIGDWWGDPFGNLERDAEVENEDIPDGLMNVIVENDTEFMQDMWPMIEKVQMTELSEEEVKAIMPESYEAVCTGLPILMDYYEVDFDNDGKKDIMLKVLWGSGHLGFSETYFYRQMETGQYKKTFGLNTSGCSGNLLEYEGKVYYLEVYTGEFFDSESEYFYGYGELYYFEDGRPQEAIRFTPKSRNIEENRSNNAESLFDITIRRRFVNDFINISEGP